MVGDSPGAGIIVETGDSGQTIVTIPPAKMSPLLVALALFGLVFVLAWAAGVAGIVWQLLSLADPPWARLVLGMWLCL